MSGTATRVIAACTLLCTCSFAHAQQTYPVKPVTTLIPFSPGTGNDLVGRIVGNKLSDYFGQRVVAENRAGATDGVAKALASKDVIDALMNQGVEPGYGSPAELDSFLKADAAMWSKLVKESGIKSE